MLLALWVALEGFLGTCSGRKRGNCMESYGEHDGSNIGAERPRHWPSLDVRAVVSCDARGKGDGFWTPRASFGIGRRGIVKGGERAKRRAILGRFEASRAHGRGAMTMKSATDDKNRLLRSMPFEKSEIPQFRYQRCRSIPRWLQ